MLEGDVEVTAGFAPICDGVAGRDARGGVSAMVIASTLVVRVIVDDVVLLSVAGESGRHGSWESVGEDSMLVVVSTWRRYGMMDLLVS